MNIETVYIIIGIAGGLLGIFMLIALIMAPKSIPNGKDFALEYHRVAGNDITDVKGAYFFYFAFWPITRDNKQVLPMFNAWWKRYWFLLGTLHWVALADAKKKGRNGEFFVLAFFRFIARLTTIAALVAFGLGIKESNMLHILFGSSLVVATFGLMAYPSYILVTRAIPIIKETKYDQKDRNILVTFVKWYFVVSIIALIAEIAEFIIRFLEKQNDN